MQDDTPMTIAERRTYLGRMRGRYLRTARAERGRFLDELEMVTGMHRKSLLRLLLPPIWHASQARGSAPRPMARRWTMRCA
jgi:hypothetical protein